MLQQPKKPIATRRNSKKDVQKQQGDGFEVQAALAPVWQNRPKYHASEGACLPPDTKHHES